ncbi:deoxyribose-phosphate aldolase [Flavobacterium sp. MAH-1]|uniref:Deoxyribose-phosphate aldolase n=1 Tax=Flavobacterium agri TaxID=2743471 RepID=A0A7Y9C7R9_9FLAO|nr:deoxyribose-phosphate aldolase [Flavobacterium agri]NUY81603.1 deoxyribose-phosphate aldolase [Flavobacterium agri]NYA71627.1 deoxyribose-phosphate aldolase [Flavobacterium agri]
MDVRQYLDSTYLKTAEQAGISEQKNTEVVKRTIQEAIDFGFKLVMIRPEHVALGREMIDKTASKVLVGTVIDFPLGLSSTDKKLAEAEKAIADGADDLDFVVNYAAFKNGDVTSVKEEVLKGTSLGLSHHKTVKWIIEVAALDDLQIARLSALIKNVVVSNFKEDQYANVFVKSSTGFYKTANGLPNGATVETIVIMLENACPLPVKAAGGVRTFAEAQDMIKLGVKRIGTSSAKAIAEGKISEADY